MRGKELRLFSSFLSNRSQMVEVDTFRSSELECLNCSSCQGSILANTFYTIYTNEVPVVQNIIKCPSLLSCLLSPSPRNLLLSDVVMEPYPTSLNLIRTVTNDGHTIKTLIAKLHDRTLKLRIQDIVHPCLHPRQDIGQTSGL